MKGFRTGFVAVGAVAALLSVGPSRPANAYSLDFTIQNNVNMPIVDMWASPRKNNGWGDPMTNVFVPAGGSQKMNLGTAEGEACYYDLRMKFRNGNLQEISSVDLCSINTLTISVRNGKYVYDTAR